jgi:hypothetical protein
MTAEEPRAAVANVIPAIKDLFISYLAKKQLRPAAWFSRIGELHPSKATIKRPENQGFSDFFERICPISILSAELRRLPDFHRRAAVCGIDEQKTSDGLPIIRRTGPT